MIPLGSGDEMESLDQQSEMLESLLSMLKSTSTKIC